MIRLMFIFAVILLGVWSMEVRAEIYSWTDQNGIKHFSNMAPEGIADPNIEYREYHYDPSTDRQKMLLKSTEWELLVRRLDEEHRRDLAEIRQDPEWQQASLDKKFTEEQDRLTDLLAEVEEQPVRDFFSYDHKRATVAYYRHLQTLLVESPEAYFTKFETMPQERIFPAQAVSGGDIEKEPSASGGKQATSDASSKETRADKIAEADNREGQAEEKKQSEQQ
jgi:hypothetical protein